MGSKDEYRQKLLDPRWQKLRLETLERDSWKCQLCGSTTKTLHVHHAMYLPDREPWEAPEFTLYTVCVDCHDGEHEGLRYVARMMMLVLAKCGVVTSADIDFFIEAYLVRDRGGKSAQQCAEDFAHCLINFAATKRPLVEDGTYFVR